ncbi:heavy-metal-associated domain-containing protein [uncultured Polaribacter sp.]|uniref:heavy-metal-associated domain-containing protein n=1 Tax=uncultured Polaribacter sp. TaxID=174711 RepID=UPI002632C32C|nr:heavy-metal-associated domain-containing protein [uncultured Polaribacter sp.]
MKTELIIQNLKCGGCAKTITTNISELNNVEDVNVNVEKSSVSFTFINDETLNQVVKTLSKLGYPVQGDKNSFVSKAKSFVSCASGKMS